jgi:hypothetical protein
MLLRLPQSNLAARVSDVLSINRGLAIPINRIRIDLHLSHLLVSGELAITSLGGERGGVVAPGTYLASRCLKINKR